MRPVQLSDNQQDSRTQDANRSEEAAIHAEIAVRILELKGLVSGVRTMWFLERLLCIYHSQPSACWLVLSLMTGDLSTITSSYTEQGNAKGRTKQAQQQELERDLNVINTHFPMLATAIIEIRSITAKLTP